MKYIIGGRWGTDEGEPSSVIKMLAEHLEWPCSNGGNFYELYRTLQMVGRGPLIWMPDIDNGVDKWLPGLKVGAPSMLLISSKRVDGRDLTDFDLVSRALETRSNLLIKIDKIDDRYVFELIDPLGNTYVRTMRVELLAKAIQKRVDELESMTRIGSRKGGGNKVAASYSSTFQRFDT